VIIIFTRPQYLILLFTIPILIFFYIVSLRTVKKKAIKFANFEAITRVSGVEIFSKNLTVLNVNIIIIILIVLAISGLSINKTVDSTEFSFVLTIDSSRSMSSIDILPNRLEAAKTASIDFLDVLPERTKMGVISFSGSSIIEQELTEDKKMLQDSIENIKPLIIGGTDIFGAIITASNLLRNEDTKSIILMSDGQANVNTIEDIITYANENKIMVHSLCIGTMEGSDSDGVSFKISEEKLRAIAESTEGRYYNIQDLDDFYSSFDDIIKTTKKRAIYDLTLYLMAVALLLFILNFVLINTRYRILP